MVLPSKASKWGRDGSTFVETTGIFSSGPQVEAPRSAVWRAAGDDLQDHRRPQASPTPTRLANAPVGAVSILHVTMIGSAWVVVLVGWRCSAVVLMPRARLAGRVRGSSVPGR